MPELGPLARGAGAEILALAQPTPDMRSTVERGLGWMEREWRPAFKDGAAEYTFPGNSFTILRLEK